MNVDVAALLAAFGDFTDRYGVPLATLAVVVFLWLRGILVTGSSAREEVAFRETLRQEERAGRLAAEARLGDSIKGDAEMIALLRDIEREVLRSTRTGPP